ncbi:MAG: hypothetical protein ACUVWZ_16585 [Anaerolineae bacterium]
MEFSDQVVLLPGDAALRPPAEPPQVEEPTESYAPEAPPSPGEARPSVPPVSPVQGYRRFSWEGGLPPQQWTNSYMQVLTHFATDPSLRLQVRLEVAPEAGVSQTRVEEIAAALRGLGLDQGRLKAEP